MAKKQVDIHNQKQKYEKLIETVQEMSSCKNKEYLEAYIKWHNLQIEKDNIAISSSWRSVRHALNLCDQFYPDISNASQKQVEKWFSQEMNKEKVHKTGTGYLKPLGVKRSPETLEDISTQAIKFFKFVIFLNKDKPLELFSSKRAPLPEVCEFIGVDIPRKKVYEKPRVSQEEIKKLIESLRSKGNFLTELCGVMTAFLNDTGMRFSEAATLRIRDVVPEDDYLVITIQESKTRTRTIVSILAKKYLQVWLSKHPKKNDPNALLFCNRVGEKVSYSALRIRFNKALKKTNIEWAENRSFHYLRHLFASRATDFPDFHLKYWMGWHDRSMRSHYTQNTYKECLKYYKDMIQYNPMLEEKLSYLDETQQLSYKELLKEEVRIAVQNALKK